MDCSPASNKGRNHICLMLVISTIIGYFSLFSPSEVLTASKEDTRSGLTPSISTHEGQWVEKASSEKQERHTITTHKLVTSCVHGHFLWTQQSPMASHHPCWLTVNLRWPIITCKESLNGESGWLWAYLWGLVLTVSWWRKMEPIVAGSWGHYEKRKLSENKLTSKDGFIVSALYYRCDVNGPWFPLNVPEMMDCNLEL